MKWFYEDNYNILDDLKSRMEDYKNKNNKYPTNVLVDFRLLREFRKQSKILVSADGIIKNILGLKIEKMLYPNDSDMRFDDIIIGNDKEIADINKYMLKQELQKCETNTNKNNLKKKMILTMLEN